MIRTPVRAPNANAHCERWISSARRECLNWLLIVGRWQLEAVVAEYVEHYNGFRPHRSLELLPPCGSPKPPANSGARVIRRTRSGRPSAWTSSGGAPTRAGHAQGIGLRGRVGTSSVADIALRRDKVNATLRPSVAARIGEPCRRG